RTLCVQGAPGTGKTAVGLHRVAYLLYTAGERLRRGGVAIVGPNRSFLAYVRDVLPALGEVGVHQTTLDDLLGHGSPTRADTPEAARVKGDARMAEVIRRDLWAPPAPPADGLVVARGGRRWRVPADELAGLAAEVRGRGVPYGAGRDLLARRVAHAVLTRMEAGGAAADDRAQRGLARSREVGAAVSALWPKADPVRLVFGLLTDPGRLARAADGLLTAEERAAVLLPGRPRGPRAARWSAADLALIDEAAALIARPAGFAHLVVDEAQDLSPMQCRALGRRAAHGSCTVLGDTAQATAPGAVADWAELLRHLGAADARLAVLDRGYRVPAQILDHAARLLPAIAPGLAAPTSARRSPGALRVTPCPAGGLPGAVAAACAAALAGEGSVGLIAADTDIGALHRAVTDAGLEASLLGTDEDALTAARLVCVPATLAKGLEFDAVVAAEPAAIAAAEPRGLNRLYVVLTRAVSTLHVVHARPLPAPLA
ncbi:HelD family protein, partial [Nocardiopsis trehalosi]|uniref:HelD family protein n=1 Tax=Nocardiopsis trehalosi TaxID=109329 RepID=UPI0009FD33A4